MRCLWHWPLWARFCCAQRPDAQTFLPLSPEQRAQQAPRVRYRSVLRPGMLGTLGAVLLLVCEVWQLIDLFRLMSAFHVSLGTLLQPALIFAAAVLLLLRAQNGPRLLPAQFCC